MQPMRDVYSCSSETASHVPQALYVFLWVQSKQSFNTEIALWLNYVGICVSFFFMFLEAVDMQRLTTKKSDLNG